MHTDVRTGDAQHPQLAMDRVNAAVAELNQALADASLAGLDLQLHAQQDMFGAAYRAYVVVNIS